MLYLAVKQVHVTSVVLSFALFAARGLWVLSGRALPRNLVIRVLPHVVDTVLLTSALWLTTLVRQYPFAQAWLTVKVAGLVVYVLLGHLALKRAPTRTGKGLAFVGACLVFAFIVSVARAHHPLGAFG